MSIPKHTPSAKNISGYAPEQRAVVSLITLAASLDDPLYYRAFRKELSRCLEQLKAIGNGRTPRLRGRPRTLSRYIE
jgi:hypothetical protein